MAIIVGDALNLARRKANIDNRWGPYASKEAAFATLDDADVLCIGLTVGIIDTVSGKVDEYWFRNACETIDDLVKKNEDDEIKGAIENVSGKIDSLDSSIGGKLDTVSEAVAALAERMGKQEAAQESDGWEVLIGGTEAEDPSLGEDSSMGGEEPEAPSDSSVGEDTPSEDASAGDETPSEAE